MIDYLLAGSLLLISVVAVVVRKTYFSLPLIELRRRAQGGEEFATRIYRSATYESSLSLLLWLIVSIAAATGLVSFSHQASTWVSILAAVVFIWLAFLWLPRSRVTELGSRLTLAVSPGIAWLLNHVHSSLSFSSSIAKKRLAKPHTGLFETNDLLELIDRQQLQSDNRLTSEELDTVKRCLHFPAQKVANVMTARKLIKIINADDTIGPILIDELHKSGQSVALVRETAKGPIIGSLQLKDLSLESTGKVRDVMEKSIRYVHENDNLSEVLQAFFVTNHTLFVVVNNAEENVGVITVQNILEQLLGHIHGDDFDQYANQASVASRHDKPKTPKPETDIDEVVEI